MSWVKFAKNAQRHPAALEVMDRLQQLAKRYCNPWAKPTFYIELAGVEEIDKKILRFYERQTYQDLTRMITSELEANNTSYEGYNIKKHLELLEFIEEINSIDHYIVNEYCLHEKYCDKKKHVWLS